MNRYSSNTELLDDLYVILQEYNWLLEAGT